MRAHRLLIPLAAFLAVVPLLLHGPSCGHDFDFHLLNWLEAARQIGAGHYPRWAYIPAWNAGEPRFLFYPPLSWLTGAALTALLPFRLVPAAYTFTCLALSGFTFHRLARLWAGPPAATLAAIFYLLNPYSLFTAYERTAYAELLAAGLIPLLFTAILRPRPTVPGIALPVALLWLTNAPAAVMSTYALLLLTLVRLFWPARVPHEGSPFRVHLARTTFAGTALGLAVTGFYLIPAAYERRWVEISMAVIEGLRPADNFLFHHTSDPAHDAVLHTASLVAVLLLTLAAAGLLAATRHRLRQNDPLPAMAVLAATIAFLLTPWSRLLWDDVPELAFLQFPWRTLALLACVVSVAAALALRDLTLHPALLSLVGMALAVVLIFHPSPHPDPDRRPFTPEFTQGCEPAESPIGRQQLTPALANTAPTDEYTPTGVDNDALKAGDPPFWTIRPGDPIDQPAPQGQLPGGAPDRLTLDLAQPAYLVLNRRWFPAWHITLNGRAVDALRPIDPAESERQDGLMVVALPAGHDTVELTFIRTRDRLLGDLVSFFALLTLIWLVCRQRLPAH